MYALAVCVLYGSITVAPESFGGASQPSVAIDSAGTVHVAFGSLQDRGVYWTSMEKGKKEFSAPVRIAGTSKLALGMRRGPRLAATEKGLVVSYTDAGNLIAYASPDGGKSWKGPSRINDEEGAAAEGLHGMAAGPGETVYVAWLAPSPKAKGRGRVPMLSISRDGGARWKEHVLVYDPPVDSICECCHPSIAVSPQGEIAVMFRNKLEGNRDMYAVISRDGGKSFAPAEMLGRKNWGLNACPMDGGAIVWSDGGKIFSAWRRESRVLATTGKPGAEMEIGRGKNPWMVQGRGGAFVLWQEKKGIRCLALGKPNASVQTLDEQEGSGDPVAASGAGTVFAAWETKTPKGGREIRGAFLP